jgi:O-antigen/teichoic acid export membrane protein
MATTVVTSVLGYVYWLIAARLYSPSQVGLSATLLSAMSLAALLAYMGVGSALIQWLPQREQGQAQSLLVTVAFTTVTCFGILGGAVLVALLPLLSPRFELLRSGLALSTVLAVGVLSTALGMLVDDATIAQRTAIGMLMRNTAFSLIKMGVLALPLCVALGTTGILTSWVVGTVATVAAGLVLLPHLVHGFRPSLKDGLREVRSIVRSLAGNHLINVGGMLPVLVLPVIVTIRLNAAQAGYFYTTTRVGGLFFMIAPSVAAALFADGAHNPAELSKKMRYASALIALLLVPAAGALIIFGGPILSAFGHAYANEGYPLLVMLAVSALPDSVTSIYTSVLRVRHRLRVAAIMYALMAVAVLTMTWLLLPVLGIVAVGVSWLVTQSAGSIFVWLDSRRSATRLRTALADRE